MVEMPTESEPVRVVEGDCLEVLKGLEAESVQCCVTSPPYFGLRDYGHVGQIGLEPTPDEYVAKLVAVFREVRRVLRDDGTLWLNLGDSYGRGERVKNPNDHKRDHSGRHYDLCNGDVYGKPTGVLPNKQLVGVPWRVAFALQQPYYAGSIKNERDRIWLAAMLDAEGCMYMHRRKAGQHNGQGYYRQNDSYSPGVEIANTCRAVVDRVMALAGVGTINEQGPEQNGRRRQTIYRWHARSRECRQFVREVYPYLVAKKHQARICCGSPTSGERAEAAHEALKILHRGGMTDVDFPEPESCFEPGYYLRQDLIWSKPNPMPESVRDRCTKAHEYLFLLSKSPRYFYDADAIAEESAQPERAGKVENTFHSPNREGAGRNDVGRHVLRTDTRNKRSVWTVCPQPFAEAHFATFPPDLIRPCVRAGCPENGVVLDPFGGAGTTGLVAAQEWRRALLVELNPEYAAMARRRITEGLCVGADSLLTVLPSPSLFSEDSP